MNGTERARACRDAMWADDLAAQALGVDVSVDVPGAAIATMKVREHMVNGHGLCHGGYIFTLADIAFAFACNTYGTVTVAAGASIDFIRPGHLGDTLTATASEAHRGGRTGVYDVHVTNGDGDCVAIFRGRSHATRQPLI